MAQSNMLDIIRGISQCLSKNYDGYDDEGERIKIGLKREEGHPILDKRVMDGFGVKFHGDKICINYHSEVNMKDLHRSGPKNFESEIEHMFENIVSFLKKEYKKNTGNSITFSAEGEAHSSIERMSSIRNWVQSAKWYKVGGVDAAEIEGNEERSSEWRKGQGVDSAIKNFLSLSSKKNPKNILRKNA